MTDDTVNEPTGTGDIAALEELIVQLPDEARVELSLDDGMTVAGVVAVRPALQVVRDARGEQGFNALLRLDDMANPEHSHWIWLDRIAGIRDLGPSTEQGGS
ncbi:DUF3247 family protein [Xanthomonas sp. XNM01]|uniref:DUF3247 family protein n=1 Tax=Xanthomonas sp. XNM01 TaxID=2769289 RepID=UPI00177C40D7|nr:DUF3247 family protein [Xanthomonas sp. XNM01]MBD9370712.1 DUF3247 family protein [Xanthomonas sp. XNM01]